MTTSQVKIDALRLADLDAVIKRYQEIDPSKGVSSVASTWQTFDGVQLNLETLRKTITVEEQYSKFARDLDASWPKAPPMDLLEEIYKPGREVSRDKSIPLGKHLKMDLGGTLGGLANAKDPAEALSVLLHDCIPCNLRTDGLQFKPDLSWLDQMIRMVTQIIDTIQSIALTFADTGPWKGNFCATLNIFKFVCLPDLSAIELTLMKNVALQAKLPPTKMPGLTDVILFLAMPFLTALMNLAMAWLNLVLEPVKCAVRAITAQVSKFQLRTKGFDAGLTVSAAGQTATLRNEQLNKTMRSLDNTTQIQQIAQTLLQIATFLDGIEGKIRAFVQKNFIDKAQGGLNNMTQMMQALQSWLASFMDSLQYVLMFAALKKIFMAEFEGCGGDKDVAFEKTKERAQEGFDKILSGRGSTVSSQAPGQPLYVDSRLFLSPDEMAALGLSKSFPTLQATPESSVGTGGLLQIRIGDQIPVGCVAIDFT